MIKGQTESRFKETVRLEGHIIDSLILPKVLDLILRENAKFRIVSIHIGERPEDASWAEIEIDSPDAATLERLLQN